MVQEHGAILASCRVEHRRGVELADIKLAMINKQGFLAKVHSGAADNTVKKISEEDLSAQTDALQSADLLVLNEIDCGIKRSDYLPVVRDLADALKMHWAYRVEFIEVYPKALGTESFANVGKRRAEGIGGLIQG